MRAARERFALPRPANTRVPATEQLPPTENAAVLRLQAHINGGRMNDAEAFAAAAVARHPLSVDLRYLCALILFALGRMDEAAQSAGSALYLDRNFVAGHLLLAAIARKSGDTTMALKAYRNAFAAAGASAGDAVLPHTDGECAARLAEAAAAAIAALERTRQRP
jgi:predicted Zn-dependent protease